MELKRQDLIRLVASEKKISDYIADCFDVDIQFSGRLSDIGFLSSLDVLLDIMGLPADNSIETNVCAITNETGVWPEWGFCRDSWIDLLDDTNPEDYVDHVLEYVNGITTEQMESFKTAHIKHPANKD